MGYLFVDRILEAHTDPAQGPLGGRGVKAVSRTDPWVRPGPSGLELSTSFVGEAVGQLAAWIAMAHRKFQARPVAGITADVEILGVARPGDLVAVEVAIRSLEDDAIDYDGTASVDGTPILRLHHAVGPLLSMGRFDDPSRVERRFHDLLDPDFDSGTPGALLWSREEVATSNPGAFLDHPAIDRVIERDTMRLVAVTCVSLNAPYLVEHFPREPVLPATMPMRCLSGRGGASNCPA